MTIDANRKEKLCKRCNTTKTRDQFYIDNNRKDKMSAYCCECYLSKNFEWRKNNPDKLAESSLWSRRKFFYGITKEDFYSLYSFQNGCCAICKIEIDETCHVDHCHMTNRVRGLLCGSCNKGLGLFQDNIISLQNAIEYLKNNIT